jgi:hypothetical protein
MVSFPRRRSHIERQPNTQTAANGGRSSEQVHYIATQSILSEQAGSAFTQLAEYFEFDVVYALDRAVVRVERSLNLEPVVNVK